MRNIFLFLKRYSILITFLVLQVVSLVMLFSYNRFHQTVYGMFSSEVSGKINERVNNVEVFFTLKDENEKLREENARLRSLLPSGQLKADTSYKLVVDTIKVDSTLQTRQYQYYAAKVISNSVFLQQNYLMLHRGSDQGIVPNMAVISSSGIVGTVVGVSKNMATVMSLLHKQSKVVAVLKKGSGLGEVSWDGKDPRYLQLVKIPKTVEVKKGDEVVTSPYSDRFPPGMTIGYVEKVEQDQETNTYILKIRAAADFYNLQHVYVVQNLLEGEMEELKKMLNKQ
ncbi:MAG: rod shape-determining protein MreC [Chitinophagia bacterium]